MKILMFLFLLCGICWGQDTGFTNTYEGQNIDLIDRDSMLKLTRECRKINYANVHAHVDTISRYNFKSDTTFENSYAKWEYRIITQPYGYDLQLWNGITKIGVAYDTLTTMHEAIRYNPQKDQYDTVRILKEEPYEYFYLDCIVNGQRKKFRLEEVK